MRPGDLDKALRLGLRGLPGGLSLYRLLKENGKFSAACTPYLPGKGDLTRRSEHQLIVPHDFAYEDFERELGGLGVVVATLH